MLTETAHKFRQGMIAANTSAVISRYARGRDLDKAEIRTLDEASRLLDETVRGATVFDPGVKKLNADSNAVRAFRSALMAVRACGRKTETSELGNIMSWLEGIQRTVGLLAREETPPNADVEAAKSYFDCLADEMSAAVSKPRADQPTFPAL